MLSSHTGLFRFATVMFGALTFVALGLLYLLVSLPGTPTTWS